MSNLYYEHFEMFWQFKQDSIEQSSSVKQCKKKIVNHFGLVIKVRLLSAGENKQWSALEKNQVLWKKQNS